MTSEWRRTNQLRRELRSVRPSTWEGGRSVPRVSGMPKQKRPFEVEVETKLTVQAFDESSARKKVERALATGRILDTDVEATGALWTYATTVRSDT